MELKYWPALNRTFAGALQHRALVMLSPISTVLVVDDNPMVRATAVRLFEDLGFKVVDAYYGAAALRLIERDPELVCSSSMCVCPG